MPATLKVLYRPANKYSYQNIFLLKNKKITCKVLKILKQAEAGIPVPELCREHGMSSATFYKWRAKYGGMDASMMRRLKDL